MNCTTQTRKPRPQARKRMPRADVLLPLPFPVLTITSPFLTFFFSVLICSPISLVFRTPQNPQEKWCTCQRGDNSNGQLLGRQHDPRDDIRDQQNRCATKNAKWDQTAIIHTPPN